MMWRALAILCLLPAASWADRLTSSGGGGVGVNGTSISPSTVTASSCIQEPADGSDFQAGCGVTRVGIGTTLPQALLDVRGAMQVGSSGISTFTAAGALNLATALTVPSGGLGATTLTDNGVIFGNGTAAVGVLPQMGNGGVVMGTGGEPSTGTISAGQYILVTNAAGSITLAVATTFTSSHSFTAAVKIGSGTVTIDGNTAQQLNIGGGPATSEQVQITSNRDANVPILRVSSQNATDIFSIAANGGIGIGDVDPPNANLRVVSTHTTATHPIFRVDNNAGNKLFGVHENGRVGIGADLPNALLHISSGNVILDGSGNPQFYVPVTGGIGFAQGATNTGIYGVSATDLRMMVQGLSKFTCVPGECGTQNTNGPATFRVTGVNDGPFTTPLVPAFYRSGAGDDGMYFPQQDVLGFSTAGSTRVVINATGQVGINLAAPGMPQSLLHMSSGTLTIDGNPTNYAVFGGSWTWRASSITTEPCLAATVLRNISPPGHGAANNDTALNCDDDDIYTSTGTTTGQWRNSRTGTGP